MSCNYTFYPFYTIFYTHLRHIFIHNLVYLVLCYYAPVSYTHLVAKRLLYLSRTFACLNLSSRDFPLQSSAGDHLYNRFGHSHPHYMSKPFLFSSFSTRLLWLLLVTSVFLLPREKFFPVSISLHCCLLYTSRCV